MRRFSGKFEMKKDNSLSDNIWCMVWYKKMSLKVVSLLALEAAIVASLIYVALI